MTDDFTTLLGYLGPLSKQERAVLILRDVLGWELGEVAELLDLRVDAANCVLLRARAAIRSATDATTPLGPSGRSGAHRPDASLGMW